MIHNVKDEADLYELTWTDVQDFAEGTKSKLQKCKFIVIFEKLKGEKKCSQNQMFYLEIPRSITTCKDIWKIYALLTVVMEVKSEKAQGAMRTLGPRTLGGAGLMQAGHPLFHSRVC